MALRLYLAMTASEIGSGASLPPDLGWMACHFSPYGTGLSNLPKALPENAMLILNDRTPHWGHKEDHILSQLSEVIDKWKCRCLLLDFQRPPVKETASLAKAIAEASLCPTGITPHYARGLDCPVFLPPAPLDTPLEEYLRPWQGREIWLEAALDSLCVTLTPEGFEKSVSTGMPGKVHQDLKLHCHYSIRLEESAAVFSLWRTPEDLSSLLEKGEELGVSQAVGLYQELGKSF